MLLQFLGAARTVTGSMYLLSINKYKVLVECGLRQGNPQEEQENFADFPFAVSAIDAVVLSHAHLDHSGRIPLLIKRGYTGPIHAHHATRDLCDILFQDAGYINEKEAIWENKKRQRKNLPLLSPLYDRQDAQRAMTQFRSHPYQQNIPVVPGVTARFHDAGHILGSCIVELRLDDGADSRCLVFSGDLGHSGAPILRDPSKLQQADVVLMESTYGDRLHRSWDQTWDELRDIFLDSDIHKGNVLIPSFAIGRAQEVMYAFARHFDQWQMNKWRIFVDSPLAIQATEIYRKYAHLYDRETRALPDNGNGLFGLPNLHYAASAEQSMALNRFASGAIIIAGSGMCDGGRIKHHLKHNIWRRDCHVLIVGFQAQGTLGRRLVDGARHVRLWGETMQVNATIHTIGGFSAHADQLGLKNWLSEFKGNPLTVLVHGEPVAMDTLQGELRRALSLDIVQAEPDRTLDILRRTFI